MTRRVLVAGAAAAMLAGIVPLQAQAPAAPAENPARSQVFLFERALRGAVELGGQQLAKQALIVAPELMLSTDEAIVRGIKLTDYGFYFDVQVPDIRGTVIVWEQMRTRRSSPVQPGSPSRPVSAAGAVAADPMTTPTPAFEPDREYTSNVRAAVIDAMLDSAGVLAIGDGERLTVIVSVSEIDHRNPNPLYRSSANKLILSIQGVDLLALRQGRITREQAKERILEDRF